MSEVVATSAGSRAGLPRVLSDERLARRAVKGDERAFAAIFDRYHQRLYRYCLAIVGDSHDAQDALQNTMVKVLRALPGEERRIELKPWLYRIAHNESIELLRRRRETRELDAELAAPGPGLAAEAASRERLRRLLSDLDQLPESQRGALVMRELSGLDFDEIGTALGTSAAVARQTLYEARLGLRQMDEGREMNCEAVMKALSDGDGRVTRRRDLRAHLRACAGCRRFREEIESRERDLAALSPLPAVAAAGLLQGLLGGGGGGAAGGGLAAGLGGGAAKTLGTSALLKGAAAVAVVAALGVGAADRGGLIGGGDPSRAGDSPAARARGAAAVSAGATRAGIPGGAGRVSRARSEAGAVGARGVDAARAAEPGARLKALPEAPGPGASAPGAGANDTGAAAGAAAQGAEPTSHPHGKGHEKRHPPAAAHGQETAASHKAAGKGKGSTGSNGHPAHPVKAPHSSPSTPPAHPAGKDPPSQAPAAAPHEKAAAPPEEPEVEAPAETGANP